MQADPANRPMVELDPSKKNCGTYVANNMGKVLGPSSYLGRLTIDIQIENSRKFNAYNLQFQPLPSDSPSPPSKHLKSQLISKPKFYRLDCINFPSSQHPFQQDGGWSFDAVDGCLQNDYPSGEQTLPFVQNLAVN
jgi:hypothetical protein